MKKIRCGVIMLLLVLVSFGTVACGSMSNINSDREAEEDALVYRISKIVEKIDGTENIYEAEYDESGAPKLYKISSNGETHTLGFHYDSRGMLECITPSYLESEFSVRYEDDKIIEIYDKTDDGNMTLWTKYQYDDANRIVVQRVYDIFVNYGYSEDDDDLYDNDPHYTEKLYSYNPEGDILDYKEVDHSEIRSVWEYENIYSEDGKLEEAKITKLNDMNAFEKYSYDEKGNVICKTIGSLSDGGKVFGEIRLDQLRYEWTYDDAGNILTEALYDMYEEEYTYKREYTYISCKAPSNETAHWNALFDITSLLFEGGWWDNSPENVIVGW